MMAQKQLLLDALDSNLRTAIIAAINYSQIHLRAGRCSRKLEYFRNPTDSEYLRPLSQTCVLKFITSADRRHRFQL
jgi:hypothetical protein